MSKSVAVGVLLAASFGAFLFRAAILRAIASAWIVDDPLSSADAIVILGGGPSTRPAEAARLYASGMARKLILLESRKEAAATASNQTTQTETIKTALVKAGVPIAAIVIPPDQVASTYDEAVVFFHWQQTNHINSVIVVTDVFHSRRARWIFRKLLEPTGVKVFMHATPVREYTKQNWWEAALGRTAFRNELIKYLSYQLKY